MSNRPINLLIEDICEAIEKINRFTANLTKETFKKDEKTSDAVVRNFEIIGEAANRLPSDFKNKHCEVEWAKIIGLRHRIVHEYFGVDMDIIWYIIQNDLPIFQGTLKHLRKKLNL